MPSPLRKLADSAGLVEPVRRFKGAYLARRNGRPREPVKGGPVTTLGEAAGTAWRYPESMRYFARGYKYAQELPVRDEAAAAGQGAGANGSAPGAAVSRENPLERYFDSQSEGAGIWKWRHYFDIYDRHLSRLREAGDPVHIVEIGVYGGGSLQMWREYFGAGTHIYGIDIDPTCRDLAGDGVDIFIGDQGDPEFWKSFLATSPKIDVVLDDGGHWPEQQMVTLECLLPAMRPGGVFICEDVQGAFQPFHAFVDGITHPLSGIGFGKHALPGPVHHHVDSVHRYPLVTVIETPRAGARRFESERHGSSFPTSKRWA
jgi:hypothetical protein